LTDTWHTDSFWHCLRVKIEGQIYRSRFKITRGKRAKELPRWPAEGENQTWIGNCK